MENASKALIIAGAILISIVLVSVGVIVVNSLNPDEALSQMSQQEVDSFNSKFVGSAGNSIQGSRVKTLIQSVITSNTNNEDIKKITVTATNFGSKKTATNASADLSAISNAVNTQHRYTVLITYRENGLVQDISITDNNISTPK